MVTAHFGNAPTGGVDHVGRCRIRASLQHYNPLIDEAVAKEWQLPETWELIAQMPFGAPLQEPGAKEFNPIEERVRIFK